MIIFGPTLILTGMILIMLNKDEFEDQQFPEDCEMYLITVEGGDGSGKGEAVRILATCKQNGISKCTCNSRA